jgi:glycosyltransferase involved in cell wall biosynthesis
LYAVSKVDSISKMISIVVPVYNEEESLGHFYSELSNTLSKNEKEYEIIFVDDGSTDSSLKILTEIAKSSKSMRIFSFRKNFGKAEALTLGFQKSRGDYVVTLDADLQDKPGEIHSLLDKAKKEKWDVICGWRKDRKDPFKKVISSKIFNYIAYIFWGLKLHDYNCGLKLYVKDAAKNLVIYGGMHRFIPLIVFQQGFSITELAIDHDVRKFGKSKYGLSKLWKDLPDIFTIFFLSKYSRRPMHFFGLVGGILIFVGFVVLFHLSILRIAGETIGGRPLLIFGALFFLAGIQLFFVGFLADLIISHSNVEKKNLLRYSSD